MKKQFYPAFTFNLLQRPVYSVSKNLQVVLFVVLIFFAKNSMAQITAAATGIWSSTSTWTGGVVPTAADNVVIAAGRTVTVNATGAVCNALRLGLGAGGQNGTVAFSGTSSLAVTGAITSGDASGATGRITMVSGATLTCSNLVQGVLGSNAIYTTRFGTCNLTGNGTFPDQLIGFNNLIINSGTSTLSTRSLTIDGDITINDGAILDIGIYNANRSSLGGTFTLANNGTLRIGGSGTMLSFFSNHSFGASSTVHFSGVNQSIGDLNSSQLYGNLIISGTGTKDLTAALNIQGNLTVNSSTLNVGDGYIINRLTSGGTLTVANGATLSMEGANPLPANFTTHTIGATSTISYIGYSPQDVTVLNSSQKYGNLTVANYIKTMVGNITVSGTLTFGGGPPNSLVIGSNTLTLEGSVLNSLTDYRNFTGSATSNMVLRGAFNRNIFMDTTSIGTTNALNNLTIDHASNITTLGNSATVYGALTFSAGKLAIGSNTLTLSGTVANTVSGGLIGSATSNIVFDGFVAGATISMDQTTPATTNKLNELTINCDPQTLTLGNAVQLAGTLFPISGTLASGGNLTLLSSSVKTANVSGGASGGGYVTGDVTVERYISSGRKWHFLSVPTGGTQTINAALQEGAAVGTSISTGYGTWLTSNVAGSTANGFDFVSTGPGLRVYNAATDTWLTASNTTDAISSNNGYMVFVRGDRGCTSTNSNVSATILRTTGTLNQGDQSTFSVSSDKFASVANTYPSAIDFRNLFITGVIDPLFYVWDPKLGGSRGLGGYQTFVNSGSDYIVTPGGGSYGVSGSICNTIQPGQAFMVHATGGAGSLQLLEGSKSGTNMLVSKPLAALTAQLRLNLIAGNQVIDGLLVQIDNKFTSKIDGMDARKIANNNESFSIKSKTILLAVERRPELQNADTMFFNSIGLKAQQYQLEIIPSRLQNNLVTAFLEDSYTGIKMPVSLTDTTKVLVVVNADVASKAANRFRIVFTSAIVLPLSFTGVKATEKQQGVQVNWQTANELNVKNYVVEKSVDGKNFTTVFTSPATGNNQLTAQYSWLDETIFTGKTFYRIKSIDYDGTSKYSETVLLVSKKTTPAISIFPNPILNYQVNVQLLAVVKGNYHFTIYNTAGQAVTTGNFTANGANEKVIINLPATATAGKYQLEIKGENEFKHNTTLLVL